MRLLKLFLISLVCSPAFLAQNVSQHGIATADPDRWKDYSSIKLSRDSYWNNQVAAARWNIVDDNWALIGDLAGAKIAYLAFKKAQQQRPAPTLDGFSPDQQFFLAWGQWRGDEIRPETQRKMVQGDPHPIAKYRVIGPLSNLPPFAQAFSCKPGQPMVRTEDRCEVW